MEVYLGALSTSQSPLNFDPGRRIGSPTGSTEKGWAHSTLPPFPTSQLPKIKQIKQRQKRKTYRATIATHTHPEPDTPPPSLSHNTPGQTPHTQPDRYLARHTHTDTPHHTYSQTRTRPTFARCIATPTHPIQKHTV